MEVTIECQKRSEGTKPKALRRSGLIPAVLYGHNGTESVALTVNAKDAETLLKEATINNTLVRVNVPQLPWSGQALLREVQTHAWKNQVFHLSFFSVAAQESIDVEVPLHFVGDAVGVKLGGVLDPVITQLQVRCAPNNIPEAIDVDVTNLEVGDGLRVEQLVLPQGVTALIDSGETIVMIAASTTAAETAADEAAGTEA